VTSAAYLSIGGRLLAEVADHADFAMPIPRVPDELDDVSPIAYLPLPTKRDD
jgi:hypothetical protein